MIVNAHTMITTHLTSSIHLILRALLIPISRELPIGTPLLLLTRELANIVLSMDGEDYLFPRKDNCDEDHRDGKQNRNQNKARHCCASAQEKSYNW